MYHKDPENFLASRSHPFNTVLVIPVDTPRGISEASQKELFTLYHLK